MENKIKSHLITLNDQRIEFVPFTEQRENSIGLKYLSYHYDTLPQSPD